MRAAIKNTIKPSLKLRLYANSNIDQKVVKSEADAARA